MAIGQAYSLFSAFLWGQCPRWRGNCTGDQSDARQRWYPGCHWAEMAKTFSMILWGQCPKWRGYFGPFWKRGSKEPIRKGETMAAGPLLGGNCKETDSMFSSILWGILGEYCHGNQSEFRSLCYSSCYWAGMAWKPTGCSRRFRHYQVIDRRQKTKNQWETP